MSDSRKDSERQKEDRERSREYAREYRERNRERIRAYQREYYEHNKDKMRERSRAYSSEHAEDKRAYQKEYYERNKDKLVAYNLERYRTLHERWDGSKDELDLRIEEAAKKCISNYPYKISLRDIADQLGVSRSTVRNRLLKMGMDTVVKDASVKDTSERVNTEIRDVLEEYSSKGLKRPPAKDIANMVGVSAATVRNRLNRMGIDTSKGYTTNKKKTEEPEKDELNIKILKFIEEYTKENGRSPSLRRIGAEFGVSGQTINNRLARLGVSKERAHGPRKINDQLWEEMQKLNGTSMIEVDRKILAMVHEAERRGVKRPTMRQISDEIGISLSSVRSRMIALGIDTSRQ